jgi:hypothetical protein
MNQAETGVRLLGPDGEELPGRIPDTEPAPPPESERDTEPDHPIPTPGVTTFTVDAEGNLVHSSPVPARDWCDWGKDTGPRLRVKGWGEIVPEKAPPRPDDPDPGDVAEAHRECRRAIDEGDDAALMKLFPDVLDELHSVAPGAPPIPPLDWTELEPALLAEWREWGRSHAVRGRSIALRHTAANSVETLVPLDNELPYLITSDERSVRVAWRKAKGEARKAAALIVAGATEELHRARAREVVAVSP